MAQMNPFISKGNKLSNVRPKVWPSFVGWIILFFSVLYQSWNAIRIGTYYDFEIDHIWAGLNLNWLKDKPSLDDVTFQTLSSYGYALTYIMWVPAKLFYSLFLNSSFESLALTSEIFLSYKNLFNFSVFLIGLIAIVVWSKLLFHTFSPLLLSVLIFSFPTLSGYGIMNPKDIPIFAGLASALALSVTSNRNNSVKSKAINAIWINLATIFVLGVRPGAAPLLILVLSIQFWQSESRRRFLRILLYAWPSLLYCYLVSATARSQGLFWLIEALDSSSNFTIWQGTMLLWGKPFATPISEFYQIGVILSQIPLFAFVSFILGALLAITRLRYSTYSIKKSAESIFLIVKNPRYLPPLLFVVVTLYIIITSPMLYDDARQTLFVWAFLIPSILISLKYILSTSKNKLFIWIIFTLVLLPIIDSIRLAPYTYTYRNEFARLISPQGFETDYWGLSGKENSAWIEANNIHKLKIVSNPIIVFKSFVPEPWMDPSGPVPESFVYQQIRRPFGVPDNYLECRLVHTVKRRPLIGQEMIMSIVRVC